MKNELNMAVPNPTPLYKRISKEELQAQIYECYGMTSLLVVKLDCTFKQLWNTIHKWHLEEELQVARDAFIEKSKLRLAQAMDSEDENTRLKAAIAVYGKSQSGTAVQVNVQNGDVDVKGIFGL